MKVLILFFLFLFALKSHSLVISKRGLPYDIVLKTGERHTFNTPTSAPIHIQSGNVLKVVDLKNKIEVYGKKQGYSQLDIGAKSYNILILSPVNFNTFQALSQITKNLLGPYPTLKENKIYISGRIYRFSDWLKFSEAFSRLPTPYLINAIIDQDVIVDAQKHIHTLLSKNHLPVGKWSFRPQLQVNYSSDYKKIKSSIKNILAPFGVKISFVDSTLGLKPLVKVKILIAEVAKESSKKLGVEWSEAFQATLLPHFSGSSVEVSLRALEAEGLSKTLASPTLLSRSGSEAQFFAGGEIPIKTISFNAANVTWKPYGVSLKIKPEADLTGNMSIMISTEVSSLDRSHSESNLPSIKAHRVSSHIDLKNSQTIIISGLLKQSDNTDKKGLSVLQQLPVLGALFKSKNFLNQKTELVVFITPSIVEESEKYIKTDDHFPTNWNEKIN